MESLKIRPHETINGQSSLVPSYFQNSIGNSSMAYGMMKSDLQNQEIKSQPSQSFPPITGSGNISRSLTEVDKTKTKNKIKICCEQDCKSESTTGQVRCKEHYNTFRRNKRREDRQREEEKRKMEEEEKLKIEQENSMILERLLAVTSTALPVQTGSDSFKTDVEAVFNKLTNKINNIETVITNGFTESNDKNITIKESMNEISDSLIEFKDDLEEIKSTIISRMENKIMRIETTQTSILNVLNKIVLDINDIKLKPTNAAHEPDLKKFL